MTTSCCNREGRKKLLEASPHPANGIDYAEFLYIPADAIIVYFFADLDTAISETNIELRDRQRGIDIEVDSVAASGNQLTIIAGSAGTYQEGRSYILTVKDANDPDGVPNGFDPRFCEFELTYNKEVGFESDFLRETSPRAATFSAPSINYLAKDYASFRQLVLDRLAITMPNWQETHAADLGMTLVELLAFVADRISYEQDAVATEAYLGTARRRTSVRRHARLVDYRMHEGCNARAFVCLEVAQNMGLRPEDLLLTPEIPRKFQVPQGALFVDQIPDELWNQLIVFEPMSMPTGDWRLKPNQIKDELAIVNLFANSPDVDSKALAGIRSFLELGLPPLSGRPDEQWLQELGEWLETVDLFEIARDQLDAQHPLATVAREVEEDIWNLDVPLRNRVIVDRVLDKYISAASIIRRIELYTSHNEIRFYTWDESSCWLPKGSTAATLYDCGDAAPEDCPAEVRSPSDLPSCQTDRVLKLKVGDWLLLEEVKGPQTDNPADADHSHRQVVKLTSVRTALDPVGGRPILEIEWDKQDALRFPLCISSKQTAPSCRSICNVSVARGNLILVDHGRTIEHEWIGQQQGELLQRDCGSEWYPPASELRLRPLRPTLPDRYLTYAQRLVDADVSATQSLTQDTARTVGNVSLLGIPSANGQTKVGVSAELLESSDGQIFESAWLQLQPEERYVLEDLLDPGDAFDLSQLSRGLLYPNDATHRYKRLRQLLHLLRKQMLWMPRFDLLGSGPFCRHFCVENEDTRQSTLRFGDGQHGLQPPLGTEFYASYRVGNGSQGNVGSEMIRRVIFRRFVPNAIQSVRNPLPASGGTEQESIEQAKLLAPHAYQSRQPRALRADDYRSLVEAKFSDRVQSARAYLSPGATFQWAEIAIDPYATVLDPDALCDEIEKYLNTVCKIGHLVTVTVQKRIPVDLRMVVEFDSRYSMQAVRQGVMQRLGSEVLPDGTLAFFHPDRLTFGQSIHSNQIVQETLKVAGVLDARVTFLGALGTEVPRKAGAGDWTEFELKLEPLEIAQLDSSGGKNAGRFCLTLEEGQ